MAESWPAKRQKAQASQKETPLSQQLVPIRTADDLLRDDVTLQMEELARNEPERVAHLLRAWIEDVD